MSGRGKLMKILMDQKFAPPKKSLRDKPRRWNIVRGDTVQVIKRTHPEYGKQGVVQTVIRDENRIIVENVNVHPHRIEADPEKGIKESTIMKEQSMHYSNVNLVDPVTGLPTRISYSFLEDGTKVRISKKSGAIIPKPDILKIMKPKSSITSEDSDTISDGDVWKVTYEEKPSKWQRLKEEQEGLLESQSN